MFSHTGCTTLAPASTVRFDTPEPIPDARAPVSQVRPAPNLPRWLALFAVAAWGIALSGATQAPPSPSRPNIVIIQADDLGLRRPERLRPGAVPDAGARSARARRHPVHAVLRGQHRLRAVARGADDRPAHRPRLDSRQRRDPAARRRTSRSRWRCATPATAPRSSASGASGGRAPPGSRTRRDSTTRSASSTIGTRTGSSPIISIATASRSPTDVEQDYVNDLFTREAAAFIEQRRPAAVLPVSELHGAARRAARAGGFAARRCAASFPRSRSSTPRPTRRPTGPDDVSLGYRSQPTPNAAFAAMITRMDRDIGRLPICCQDARPRRPHAVHVHQRQRPAPGRRRRSGLLQELRRAARHQARSLRRRHPRADDRAAGRARSRPAASARTRGRTGTCSRRSRSSPARRRPPGLDGMSMARALRGQPQPAHEFLYWEFHERGFQQAVRMGAWKAVRLEKDAPLELYNLDAIPPSATTSPPRTRRSSRRSRPTWRPRGPTAAVAGEVVMTLSLMRAAAHPCRSGAQGRHPAAARR